jgi:hypothetical protein
MAGVLSSGVSKPGTGDIEGVTAGVGLSGGGTSGTVTVTLDLSELSAVTPTNGDSLSTIDSDGSTEQLTTIAALATLLAGAGLTASNSVIGADDSTASAKGIVIVAGGDGISVSYSSGTATSAVDLGTNSGLEISSNKLQIAKGISQHDTAQFAAGVVDDDFLRIDGTTVEGRSASEVLSDISAAPAAGSSNIVTTGALDSGSITSGFGNIDTGSSTITTTGAVSTGTIAAGDDVTIADGKGIVLDSTPADDAYTGIYGTFANATGSTITKGQVVYMTGTANQVAPARANAAGTMPAVAMAIADVANGASGNFLMYGFAHDSSAFVSLTIGGEVYVSDSAAGALDATAPADDGEFVQILGIGMHGDKIFFNPQLAMVEIA